MVAWRSLCWISEQTCSHTSAAMPSVCRRMESSKGETGSILFFAPSPIIISTIFLAHGSIRSLAITCGFSHIAFEMSLCSCIQPQAFFLRKFKVRQHRFPPYRALSADKASTSSSFVLDAYCHDGLQVWNEVKTYLISQPSSADIVHSQDHFGRLL